MIRPELRELLQAKTQELKIVLRVPALAQQVSQTEREKRNKLYDIIEKEFYKAGFIVRDRALLEEVLRSGTTSYKDVAQKIDTDLILEIVSIEAEVDLSHRSYYDPARGSTEQLIENRGDGTPGPLFSMLGGRLECRIITVKDGAITGIFTIFCVPLQPKFEVIASHIPPRNPEPNPNNYVGYKFGNIEQTTQGLAMMLAQTLLGHKMVITETGTQASKYGLQAGDVIWAINGQEVFNFSQATELIENSKGAIELALRRGAEALTISLPNSQALADLRFQFRAVK